MKIDRRSGTDERRIITAMITDSAVLGAISAKWRADGLFHSTWGNLVGRWAVKYYLTYNKPPGRDIEAIFSAWANKESRDDTTVELVEKFLSGMSTEYELEEVPNSQYILDLAGRHFNQVQIQALVEQVKYDVDEGLLDDAIAKLSSYGKVEMGTGSHIDVLSDEAAIKSAFESEQESLIKYDGAIGEFFGNDLGRDAFVAFLAPPKVGKTFMLLDVAFRATLQRRKVAFFQVGDMSQDQIMRRFMARICRQPIHPQTIKIPRKFKRDDDGIVTVVHEDLRFEKGLEWKQALEMSHKCQTKQIRSATSYLKLWVEPNSTINVSGIRAKLQTLERDEWVPDVIVIDYADILAPPDGFKDSREQIIATWRQLRSLSQTNHCLVVTATQSNADGMNVGLLGMRNFSGSMLKLAEANGIIGINQTPREREMDMVRLNWITVRESENTTSRQVSVAGCRAVANTTIISSW